jgi:WD40 repeat protein
LIAKIYNITIVSGKVYLNNGTDIVSLEEDKAITDSADRTQQLELQYPFLIQRNTRDLRVFNYGQFNPLFTIPIKAISCSLFNSGFLLLVSQGEVALWDLAKNEKIFTLAEEWTGCWAKKNKCLLWREN